MIQLNEVIKSYGPGGKRALDGVSLSIPQGEIVGLFGRERRRQDDPAQVHPGPAAIPGAPSLWTASPSPARTSPGCPSPPASTPSFPASRREDHRIFYRAHFPAFRGKRFRALMEFFELPFGKPLRHFSTGQKTSSRLSWL